MSLSSINLSTLYLYPLNAYEFKLEWLWTIELTMDQRHGNETGRSQILLTLPPPAKSNGTLDLSLISTSTCL